VLLAGNVFVAPLAPVPLGALLALAWVRATRTPWAAIGYARLASAGAWVATIVGSVALGALFKLVMKALVMPLLGARPENATYHFLVGDRTLLPAAVATSLIAGFGEETVFRGFLFLRLERWFGTGAGARVAIVVVSALLFALAHYADQGIAGAAQALCTGLVFGVLYARTRRIWAPMIAHAAFDLVALWIIYAGLEARVAHWFLP
jgi:membrane protease YdiL (CAAX protease family)